MVIFNSAQSVHCHMVGEAASNGTKRYRSIHCPALSHITNAYRHAHRQSDEDENKSFVYEVQVQMTRTETHFQNSKFLNRSAMFSDPSIPKHDCPALGTLLNAHSIIQADLNIHIRTPLHISHRENIKGYCEFTF